MLSMAYIAFGSNLGDRWSNIEQALESLAEISRGEMKVSSLWRSVPAGMEEDAGEFLNGAVRIRTSLSPRELLAALQSIEEAIGRPREHGKNQARTMDLDIICIDDVVFESPDLVIPHPRARERNFVLIPLAEIEPELIMPGETETVSQLADGLPSTGISRVSG